MPLQVWRVHSLLAGVMRTQSMQDIERTLRQSEASLQEWGTPELTLVDRHYACRAWLERYLSAVLTDAPVDRLSVSVVQGVGGQRDHTHHDMGAAFSLQPGSDIVCQIREVSPLGRNGSGGGRYVFANDGSLVVKQGPGNQTICAMVQVSD